MKRKISILAITLFAFTALMLTTKDASAVLTANANLSVSGNVSANCLVSTGGGIAFNYISGQAGDSLANGNIAVECNAGTNFSLDLGTGNNYNTGIRHMNMGPDFLAYNLYWDAPYTLLAGFPVGGSQKTGIIANGFGTPNNITVAGVVPGGQFANPGINYIDSVVVTVSW